MNREEVSVALRFSVRISKLPAQFQVIFFEDLEAAIDNSLKALEAAR